MNRKDSAGVRDEPLLFKAVDGDEAGLVDKERLGLTNYYKALAQFIRETDTPMTIGIQGQWGSGKSTLMNHLWKELGGYDQKESKGKSITIAEDDGKQTTLLLRSIEGGQYLNIWVNSWEHQLMASPEAALIKVLNQITSDIGAFGGKPASLKNIHKTFGKLGKSALRMTASMYMGVAAAEVVKEWTDGRSANSIKELRGDLEKCISDIRNNTPSIDRKFIIYIDDLDRLEPKIAVQMLELLKNIFNLEHCVFVLAIDYDVIVKGLKDKYGDETGQNQREYRSFFDKIIQLPFTMPVDRYEIAEYVIELLERIGYIKEDEKITGDHHRKLIQNILAYTIGGNPRSIKRMVNNLSLIRMVQDSHEESDQTDTKHKLALFALVCCQIAHPSLYTILRKKPDFLDWDLSFAAAETLKKEETKDGFADALRAVEDGNSDWDTEWEQALFRICYASEEGLRERAIDLSRFLSLFEKRPVVTDGEEGEQWIGFASDGINAKEIDRLLNRANVTSVSSSLTTQVKDAWKSKEDQENAEDLWGQIFEKIGGETKYFSEGEGTRVSGTIRRVSQVNGAARFILSQTEPSISLFIDKKTKGIQKRVFKKLEDNKADIEKKINASLEWQGLGHSKLKVVLADPALVEKVRDKKKERGTAEKTPPESMWEEVVTFFETNAQKFIDTLDSELKRRGSS